MATNQAVIRRRKPKPGNRPVAPRARRAQLGTVGGRSLLVYRRGRDVVIAWGEDALTASIEAAGRPDRSIAPLCADWLRQKKSPPQRLGVIWPARCWPPIRGVDTTTPAWRCLPRTHRPSGGAGPERTRPTIRSISPSFASGFTSSSTSFRSTPLRSDDRSSQ